MRFLPVVAVAVLVIAAGCGPKQEKSAAANMSLSGTAGDTDRNTDKPGPAKADLKEADRLFGEGQDFYRKGRPGTPDSNRNLQQAAKRLRAAQAIYEKAAKADPGNDRIQDRLLECNKLIYSCMKMQTL